MCMSWAFDCFHRNVCAIAKRKMIFVIKRTKFEGNCSELSIANVKMNTFPFYILLKWEHWRNNVCVPIGWTLHHWECQRNWASNVYHLCADLAIVTDPVFHGTLYRGFCYFAEKRKCQGTALPKIWRKKNVGKPHGPLERERVELCESSTHKKNIEYKM